VIVCDGFVGNALLKFAEGMISFLTSYIKEEMQKNLLGSLAGLALRPSLRKIKSRLDPSELGGAPLLGVNGTCIVSHGSSSAVAIKNAIIMGSRCVHHQLNDKIMHTLGGEQAKTS